MEQLLIAAIVALVASHIGLIVFTAKHSVHIEHIYKLLDGLKIK